MVAHARSLSPDDETPMEVLFAGLQGSMLVDAIFEAWGDVSDSGTVGTVVLPWFDATDCRAVVKHPMNRPLNEAAVNTYMGSILKDGLAYGARGEAWLVWSRKGSEVRCFPLQDVGTK